MEGGGGADEGGTDGGRREMQKDMERERWPHCYQSRYATQLGAWCSREESSSLLAAHSTCNTAAVAFYLPRSSGYGGVGG